MPEILDLIGKKYLLTVIEEAAKAWQDSVAVSSANAASKR